MVGLRERISSVCRGVEVRRPLRESLRYLGFLGALWATETVAISRAGGRDRIRAPGTEWNLDSCNFNDLGGGRLSPPEQNRRGSDHSGPSVSDPDLSSGARRVEPSLSSSPPSSVATERCAIRAFEDARPSCRWRAPQALRRILTLRACIAGILQPRMEMQGLVEIGFVPAGRMQHNPRGKWRDRNDRR
jgi:hypothetical protein